ncbi:FAD-binding protein [bacterium]|nr:FAD-binding protein [bacterium]
MSGTTITRRKLVRDAACASALVMGSAALGASAAQAKESSKANDATGVTFADTIAWNAEYDVVVIGFGAAGGIASIYAADAGARVLLCDVAPRGHEGGNSRYAAQMMCGAVEGSDPDDLYAYYRNGLAGHFDVDEEALRTYTDGLCAMPSLLAYLGVDEPYSWPAGTPVTPEYPEYNGSDVVTEYFVHQGIYDSALWKLIRKNVLDRADGIDVWYESPAQHLVQDPDTKTVVGVQIERGGETVYVRALNGVVLTCGGFENNPEMVQDHLGSARFLPLGSLYNKGDGVRMGIEVGADLWHMEAYETLGMLCGHTWLSDGDERAVLEPSHGKGGPLISIGSEEFAKGSVILVGDDGSRFVNENEDARHGHVYDCGFWRMPTANYTPHLIFDQTELDYYKENGRMTDEREAALTSAATPEELAEKIGADPDVLAKTIADWNFFCAQGCDYGQGRDPESMRAFDGGIYFAAEMRPDILNTQGGPRRNKNAEVLDTAGKPIPHLYSAGELGGMCAFQYQSGGNLGECMVYGKIAGTNAAVAKDALPVVDGLTAVKPDIRFTAGQASDEPFADADVVLGARERLGTSTAGMGDDMQLKVTVENGKITAVEVVRESETPEYGGKALDTLVSEAVKAGSAEIDVVSGATMTSAAFMEALQDALAQG